VNKRQPTNLPASIRQRLLNLSRERGEDFNLTLTRYGTERLLYRLSQSERADHFVLKGALLLSLWTGRLQRPTRDLDLLGYGDSSQEALTQLFREICLEDVAADGLSFHPDSVRVTEIREEQEYGGQRVEMMATLGNARINLQVDIGFGDVITPATDEVEYPSLLGLASARIRAYPKETVIAEKLDSMVMLGMANSRLKDFYDVWMMSRELQFDGQTLARAIHATFQRRGRELPHTAPMAFTEEFAGDDDKGRQWNAFLSRNRLDVGGMVLTQVIWQIRQFLMPPMIAAASQQEYEEMWPAGGPWVAKREVAAGL
jgi:predicted nucleotidyltransferase component of viral defense system